MTSLTCGRLGHLHLAIYHLNFKTGRNTTLPYFGSVFVLPMGGSILRCFRIIDPDQCTETIRQSSAGLTSCDHSEHLHRLYWSRTSGKFLREMPAEWALINHSLVVPKYGISHHFATRKSFHLTLQSPKLMTRGFRRPELQRVCASEPLRRTLSRSPSKPTYVPFRVPRLDFLQSPPHCS